ncbi:MAG: type II pantothenate kinase [Clostridia bacterium]|nr:type II pantothenate kinase [Clostridia bacterium]
MKAIIGIDIGGSTTKIVGFTENMELIEPMSVRATDPITSVYGAFGKFLSVNALDLTDVEKVMITGVGSSYINKPLYGLSCSNVTEFQCVGRGGIYLSGLTEAIIVSMGTGTAITHCSFPNTMLQPDVTYLGGTGVGGGTLMGLSKKMLGMDNVDHIAALAEDGNLDNIDLRIKDITSKDILPGMPGNMTAANFGKVTDLAGKADMALGIINMIFETAGMLSIFAARSYNIKDIVLTGNLTTLPQAEPIFGTLSEMFHVNFRIPEHSRYATVIGAALSYFDMLGDPSKKD